MEALTDLWKQAQAAYHDDANKRPIFTTACVMFSIVLGVCIALSVQIGVASGSISGFALFTMLSVVLIFFLLWWLLDTHQKLMMKEWRDYQLLQTVDPL